jgi:hypothetical protein
VLSAVPACVLVNERLLGLIHRAQGNILPLIDPTPLAPLGQADKQIQCYNYRLCITKQPALRVPFVRPASYNASRHVVVNDRYACTASLPAFNRWQLFRNLLAAQPSTTLGAVFAIEGPLGGNATARYAQSLCRLPSSGVVILLDTACSGAAHSLHASKWDLNVGGPISTDYIGAADLYPTAAWPERDAILADHKAYTTELLWFLSTDPAVPAALQG